jgi:hypothetical protein
MTENFLKDTKSICPECHQVISARIFERDGKVMMSKSCPNHGYYEDVYWSDFQEWDRVRKYSIVGDGLANPRTKTVLGCPYD